MQGKVETQGAPNDLSKSGIDFASLLKADDVTDEETAETELTTGKFSRSNSRSSSKSSLSDSGSKSAEANGKSVEALQQLEASSKGQVKGSISGTYLKSGANFFVLAVILILFVLTQVLASGADYWVSFWTSQEELRHFYSKNNSDAEMVTNLTESSINENEPQDASGLLSTETLINIHGGLMGALFIIALFR